MDNKVIQLLKQHQYKQRTKEWYDVREDLVTASSAASLLVKDDKTCDPYISEYNLQDIFEKNGSSCNPYTSKNQYFLEKCKKGKFTGNMATYWGNKYEQVVTDIYSVKTNKDVLEFGLLLHPKYHWLGASPDGITPDGIMVEIKCPFRRKITGVPNFYYWIQVQLQLEVCDLEYCDFVEYEFTEFVSEEEFLDDKTLNSKPLNKGLFICVERQTNPDILADPAENQYVYPEKHFIDKTDDLLKWRDIQLANLPKLINVDEYKNDIFTFKVVYWKVFNNSIVRIKRDREWFNNVVGTLREGWDRLKYYQKNDNYKKLIVTNKEYLQNGKTLCMKSDCMFSSDSETE